MATKSAARNRIVVDLGDVRFPPAIASQLELDIRKAVLAAVAQIKVPVVIGPRRLPPGTMGLILRPFLGGKGEIATVGE